jgi:signal transduction histidine kinase
MTQHRCVWHNCLSILILAGKILSGERSRGTAVFLARRQRTLHGEAVSPELATVLIRKDGSRLPVALAVTNFVDGGRIMGRCAVVHDLTAQQRPEAERQTMHQLFSTILDALSAHIAILDARATIVAVNTAWRHFADANGLRVPSYGIGMNYLALCMAATGGDSQTAQTAAAGIRELLAHQREEFLLEYPCHSPTEERWFLLRAKRFAGLQEPYVIVEHENITSLKRAEAEARRTEHLALLGRLASAVTHEIRNPLHTLFLYAELLEEELQRLPSTHAAPMAEAVTAIQTAIARLQDVVQDYLSLARLASLQRQQDDLGALVQTCAADMEDSLVQGGIRLMCIGLPDLGHTALHHSTLRRLVLNLMQNALEAMPEGGTLTLHGSRTASHACLEVRDTGQGIPPEQIQHIFEPLYTSKPEGTGLGLYLVREIVAAHEGHIEVQSDVGRGTTFTVTLPLTAS